MGFGFVTPTNAMKIFDNFDGEEKKKIVFESTFNLKGPRYLAQKHKTVENVIVSILWEVGLEPTPNDWHNLDFNNYLRRTKNMELCVYIKNQKEYLNLNESVNDQLWLERLKVPHDLSKYPDFPVRPENIS